MLITATVVKLMALIALTTGWLAAHQRVRRLESDQPYHLAADRRDRRQGRFYFLSVWIGLIAAFLCMAGSEGLAKTVFESTATRDWVMGLLYGVGLWGLVVSALVWSQVGQRASQPNADGKSLTPSRQKRE